MPSPQNIPVNELLPHRPPVILIDALLEASETRGAAAKTFRGGDYGLCGDLVCEPALIECAAQTVAALFGYQAFSKPGTSALGFLAGVSSFSFSRRPSAGEPLRIEVEVARNLGPLFMVNARVLSGAEQVAGGELKLYLQEGKQGTYGQPDKRTETTHNHQP